MIPFRLVICVFGIIFINKSLSYNSYPGVGYGAPEIPYGYMPIHSYGAYPASGGYGYGSKGYGYSSGSYGGSGGCSSMKVSEVLDHIWCDHGMKRRYTSTIYPKIEVVIDQLEYVEEWFELGQAYEYVQAAIDAANNFQDSTYGNFGESSLLNDYDEGYDDSSGQSQSITGSKGTKSRSEISNKMTNMKTRLANNEIKTKQNSQTAGIFSNQVVDRGQSVQQDEEVEEINIAIASVADDKTQINNNNANSKTVVVQASNSKSPSKKVQFRAHGAEVNDELEADKAQLLELQNKIAKEEKETLVHTPSSSHSNSHVKLTGHQNSKRGALPMSHTKRNATSYRKIRGTEYSDYTCPLLPAIYCSEDKYDELLYNMLERLFVIINFCYAALDELDAQLQQAEYIEDIYLLALAEGSILTTTYTLSECIDTVFRYYEIMELEYGDGHSYRAKDGNPAPQGSNTQGQMMRPVMQSINKNPVTYVKTQTYPMTYVSQPTISTYPMTQPPQQYRTNRAVVTPIMTQLGYPNYILVG